jgi:hypothetical protein
MQGCWLINIHTYVIKSFLLFHSTVAPIIFLCSKVFFHQSFFTPPPPGSCNPLFTFLYPFYLPDFLQPACFSLLCLFALFVASVAPVRFWVSCTDRCCGRSAALLTHGQHHTWTRAIKHVCGGFPPERFVSPGNVCASAPLPPPCPRGYYWQTPRPSPLNRVLVYTAHDLAAGERSRCH